MELHVMGRSYRVKPWFERTTGELESACIAGGVIARVAHDFLGARELRRALEEVEGWMDALDGWELEQRVVRAVEDGRLVLELVPEPVVHHAAPASAVAEEEPPPPAEEEAPDWIEIELVDLEGRPVPHARYELVLEGGGRRAGALDENGWARVEGLTPGACRVTFPEWDAYGWRAA